MTQKDKDLLLKDLCARLPYGVVIEHCSGIIGTLHDLFVHWFYDENDTMHNREASTSTFFGDANCDISKFKPYLFPLSSMTEEQKKEYNRLKHEIPVFHYEYGDVVEEIELFDSPESFEYLIENHFDYHGLIPMGLANDVTNLNIY